MAESLVALQSFIGRVGKVEMVFRNGEVIAADHPAVKKWPQFFGHIVQHHEIEAATAAPGEKRK
jgi:hypothetical protein